MSGENDQGSPQKEWCDDDDDNSNNFYGYLQKSCVRSQKIQDFILEIKKQLDITTEEARSAAISEFLKEKQNKLTNNVGKISSYLETIQDILKNKPCLNNKWGRDLERIKTDFEYINVNSEKEITKDTPANELIDYINKMDENLQDMIYRTSRITIPPTAKKILEKMRVGHYIDFHDIFKGELRDESNRKKILVHLSNSSEVDNGVVDIENGLIIRVEKDIKKRKKSLSHIVGLLISPLVLLALAWIYIRLIGPVVVLGLPTDESQVRAAQTVQTYIITYAALAIGAISHIGFQSLKQYRKDKRFQFQALEDIYLWVNVKEMSLCLEVLTIIAVFIFAAAFVPSTNPISWETAFLFGYSYDSFFDTFALRFESTVSGKTEVLKSDQGK
jgi:hypothetical protein